MKFFHHHIALLLLASSVTLLVAGLYVYLRHEVDALVEQAVVAHGVVAVEAFDQTQAESLAQTYAETSVSRARVESLFIPDSNAVSFIEAIEALGQQSGSTVTLSSIDADNLSGAASGTLGAISASVDVHGSWSSVMRTLILAETLPYVVSVSEVKLDANSVVGQGASVKRAWSLSFKIQGEMIASGSSSQ